MPIASLSVGTSLKAGLRSAAMMARLRALPASIIARASGTEQVTRSRPPAARSCIAGAAPFERHPGDVVGLQAHRLQPADQREMPDAALAGAGGLELAGRRRLDRVGELLDGLVGAATR